MSIGVLAEDLDLRCNITCYRGFMTKGEDAHNGVYGQKSPIH